MNDLGLLLRHWRSLRGMSQLALASDAGSTPRYVSFVETGRARPSRQMVLRLATALDVPLRERNDLLGAAGFAPVYGSDPLGPPVDRAVAAILDGHDPLPAVAMDREWTVLRANRSAVDLFTRLFAPAPMPDVVNVLDVVLEPGPVQDRIRNLDAVVPALLERIRREAVGGVLDDRTAERLGRHRHHADMPTPSGPVVDLRFDVDGEEIAYFSVVATIGTPTDVSAQELRLELFFPA